MERECHLESTDLIHFKMSLNKTNKTNKWVRTAQRLKSPLTGKAKSEGTQAGTKRSSQRGSALLTIYADIFLALDASEALNFLLFFLVDSCRGGKL